MKYRDSYRERLRELIDTKVRGQELVPEPAVPLAPVIDILEALKASLAKAKEARANLQKPAAISKRKRTKIPPELPLLGTTPGCAAS